MSTTRGFGGAVRSPRQEPPAAAGITGANNGLDVDGVNAVLGQDPGEAGNPAQLLSDREIPMNNARFTMINGIDTFLDLDSLTQISTFGASQSNAFRLTSGINEVAELFFGVGTRALNFDFGAGNYSYGDTDGVGNGGRVTLNDSFQFFVYENSLARFLNLNPDNNLFQLGDIDYLGTGQQLNIDGNTGIINLISDGVAIGASLQLNGTAGVSRFGDINAILNGTRLEVDDTSGTFFFSNTANTAAFNINGVAGFTGTVANPVTITVDGGIVTNVA